MTHRVRQHAPRLLLLFALAATPSGCDWINSGMSTSNAQGTPGAGQKAEQGNTLQADTPIQPDKLNGFLQRLEKLEAKMPREPQEFLRISRGLWLDIAAMSLGVLGIGLASWSLMRRQQSLERLSNKIDDQQEEICNLEILVNPSDSKASLTVERINKLEKNFKIISGQLERLASQQLRVVSQQSKPSFDLSSLDQPLSQAALTQQIFYNAEAAQQITAQPSPPPSPAQLLSVLTEAINRGDRQVIRAQTRAQLNITSASENNISTGTLTNTQLEEVPGGGSYWLASIGGEDWLYPTNQTLKGYAQLQPSKGIFSYSKQAISTPQVLLPARLAASGSGWEIVEMGSIAIPG